MNCSSATELNAERLRSGLVSVSGFQVCIAEVLYDVDSIVADPGAYTKEELASLHSQIVSNLEQAWELTGGSEDQLLSTMMQISQVVARQFNKQE